MLNCLWRFTSILYFRTWPRPVRVLWRNKVVKIRLKKFGTQKRPYYRVIVIDERKPRDGTAIEEVGTYQPIESADKQIDLNMDRVKYWMSVGAQPTAVVGKLINKQNKVQSK